MKEIVVVNGVINSTNIELLTLYVIQGIVSRMLNIFPSMEMSDTYTISLQLSEDKDFSVFDIIGNHKEYFIEQRVKELLKPYIYDYRFIFVPKEEGNHLRILLQRFDVETEHINIFHKHPVRVKSK